MAAVLKEEHLVEARIARLEADVAHIRSDVSKLENDMGEVKKGLSDLRVEVSDLRGELRTMGAALTGKIDKAIAETRLWILVLGGILAVLMNVLSQRFHWLGLQ
jgi:chromosome segregation ATPase